MYAEKHPAHEACSMGRVLRLFWLLCTFSPVPCQSCREKHNYKQQYDVADKQVDIQSGFKIQQLTVTGEKRGRFGLRLTERSAYPMSAQAPRESLCPCKKGRVTNRVVDYPAF